MVGAKRVRAAGDCHSERSEESTLFAEREGIGSATTSYNP